MQPLCFFALLLMTSLAFSQHIGRTKMDVNSEPVQLAAWKAAGTVTKGIYGTGQRHWIPVRVESAYGQVVDGVLYSLTIIVAQSTCKKSEVRRRM